MAPGYRPDRVGDQIRQHLSEMLTRGDVRDPGIGFITLTRVKVSPDLQVARVFYTTLGDSKARGETARALERATPFLRRQIGSTGFVSGASRTIEFRFDETIQHQDRIEQILRDLREEEAGRTTSSDPGSGPADVPHDDNSD